MDVLLISVKEINKLMTKECQIFTFTLLLRKTDVLKYRFFNLKKKSSPSEFLGSFNSRRYHWILKILVPTLKSEVWDQKHM